MIHIYHPNKNNTGFACAFKDALSVKDNFIFATLVKQSGWDEKSGNGIFKASLEDPTKHVNVKLSDTEVAAILDCIERNRPFQSYHDAEDISKTIHFTPWFPKVSNEDNSGGPPQRGFSFSVSITNKQDSSSQKNSFYIGLTFAEARLIREYLLFCLNSHFTNVRNNVVLSASPTKASPLKSKPVEQVSQSEDII